MRLALAVAGRPGERCEEVAVRMWFWLLGVVAVLALGSQFFKPAPTTGDAPSAVAMPKDLPFSDPKPNGRVPLPRSLGFHAPR